MTLNSIHTCSGFISDISKINFRMVILKASPLPRQGRAERRVNCSYFLEAKWLFALFMFKLKHFWWLYFKEYLDFLITMLQYICIVKIDWVISEKMVNIHCIGFFLFRGLLLTSSSFFSAIPPMFKILVPILQPLIINFLILSYFLWISKKYLSFEQGTPIFGTFIPCYSYYITYS